jgi:predicted NBD/HSP70 family sugar kinase
MRNSPQGAHSKRKNKARILNYIFQHGHASKVDLANDLKLSMPTILQNVKELTERGMVQEIGNYQSTGGRKAKALSLVANNCFAIGVDITANHLGLVGVNAMGQIVADLRLSKRYEDTFQYYQDVAEIVEDFIRQNSKKIESRDKIIGIGVSIPGIIDKTNNILIKSHALQVSNISLQKMSQFLPYHVKFDNDANCAAYTELSDRNSNVIYLSLNNTVGGAISYNGKLYEGDNFKSGEFGHIIIVPGGKRCYCGKLGCLDCYCSALALSSNTGGNLEKYFELLGQGDPHIRKTWDEYLKYLALAVSNLRMAFDCDIIIGGYVGGYLKNYRMELNRLVMQMNNFDFDTSYLRCGKYHMEASACGIAIRLIQDYYDAIE